jgi:hypothetical protein
MLHINRRTAVVAAASLAWMQGTAWSQILLSGYTRSSFGTVSPTIPFSPYTIDYVDPLGRVRTDTALEIGEPSAAVGNDRFWRFSNQSRRHGSLYELNSTTFSRVGANSPFLLADFQYFNAEVFAPGASIFNVPVVSTLDFDDDPGIDSASFGFNFRLTFTDNQGTTAGLPDALEFVNAASAETFSIASRTYALRLVGFSDDGGVSYASKLTLPEYQATRRGLYAQFEEVTGPRLFVSAPERIHFQTRVGRSQSQSIRVHNSGASETVLTGTLGGVSVGTGGFSSAGGADAIAFALGAGQSVSRNFTYAPTARTRGTPAVQPVSISSDAGDQTVQLIGEAFGPVYFSFPLPGSSVSMGRVMSGTGSTLLNISNITDDGERESFTYMTLRSFDLAGANATEFAVGGVAPGTRLGFNATRVAQLRLVGTQRGEKSASLSIDTDVGADLGADGANYHYQINATAVDKRRIVVDEVDFGRVMRGVAQSPRTTSVRGAVTADNFYTRPGIRIQGSTSGPVTVAADTAQPAPDPSTPWRTVESADGRIVTTRQVTGTFNDAGTRTGTVPLFTRPEGLAGEGTYDLAVPWRATAVDDRTLAASSASFGNVFVASPQSRSSTLSTTGEDDRFTRVRLNAGTHGTGIARVAVPASTVFNGPDRAAAVSVNAVFTQPGPQSGAVVLSSANGALAGEGLAGEAVRQTVVPWSASVFTRGTPSFSPGSASSSLLIDFGSLPAGSGLQNVGFNLNNLATSAFTAAIEFDGITTSSGDFTRFATNLPPSFTGLNAGGSRPFSASFDTSAVGTFTATYQLGFFDQRDVAGAALSMPLTLTLSGTVLSASAPTRTNIVIDNPSFEFVREVATDPNLILLQPGESTLGMSSSVSNIGTPDDPIFVLRYVPGWNTPFEFDGLAGVTHPDPLAEQYDPGQSFQGRNTSYLGNDQYVQTVVGTFMADETYELSFLVGRRNGQAEFASPSAEVLLGSAVVTPLSVEQPIPDEGEIVRWTARYRIASGDPLLGSALQLRFSGDPGSIADIDDVKLVIPGFGPAGPFVSRWNWPSSGMWSEVGKWSYGVPDFPGSEAQFNDALNAPATIFVDDSFVAGILRFDHSVSYNIASWNDQKITLDSGDAKAPAQISVLAGRHTISAGVDLNSDLTVSVAAGQSLTISGIIESSSPRKITRNGTGTLSISRSPKLPAQSSLIIQTGTTTLLSNLGAADVPTTHLSVTGANTLVELNASQDLLDVSVGAASRVRFGSLFGVVEATSVQTTGGRFDIGNATLLIDYRDVSPFDSVLQQIVSAYNGGAWDGPGITSRFAGDLLSVAVAEATELLADFPAEYAGRMVDASSLIVRLVPAGDSDLSGEVAFEDLLTLAQNYNRKGVWTDGDNDYDGNVGFADLIAFAQGMARGAITSNQTRSLDSAFVHDLDLAYALVPEPSSILVFAGASAVLLRRVRR